MTTASSVFALMKNDEVCRNQWTALKAEFMLLTTKLSSIAVVQLLSCVQLFAARQASLSFTSQTPNLEFVQTHIHWVSDAI